MPCVVAKTRYLRSEKSRVGMTDITFSFSLSGSTLTSARPPEARLAHVQYRLCVRAAELELGDEPLPRRVRVLGTADQLDHRVEIVERDQQPLEDVGARLCPGELVLSPPGDHFLLMADVLLDQ